MVSDTVTVLMEVSPPSPPSPDSGDVLSKLVPALSQTFTIILVGFLSYDLFGSKGQRSIELLVTRYTLPCLVLVGIAGIDFMMVNWIFVLAVFIAKSLTFIVTILVTVTTNKLESRDMTRKMAAIRGMFTTQSNDFALGIPIFRALFPVNFLSYIYLVSPISLVLLNPIAFVLLEWNKDGDGEEEDDEEDEDEFGDGLPNFVKVVVDNNTDEDSTIIMIQTEFEYCESGMKTVKSRERSSSYESLRGSSHSNSWGKLVHKTTRILDSLSLNVTNATIHNDPHGQALDVLHVQTQDGKKIEGQAEINSLQHVIEEGLLGKTTLRQISNEFKKKGEACSKNSKSYDSGSDIRSPSTSVGRTRTILPTSSEPAVDSTSIWDSSGWARKHKNSSGRFVDNIVHDVQVENEDIIFDEETSQRGLCTVLMNVLLTPVVSGAILGVLVNLLITHGDINKIPTLVLLPLQIMGNAYAALALFALGLSLASLKTLTTKEDPKERLKGLIPFSVADVRLVCFLVAMKTILVPYVSMQITYIFSNDSDVSVAAFVYGMLPSAPSVSLFASLYKLKNEIKIIPAATLVGTCATPPLVYLGARLMIVATMSSSDMEFYNHVIDASIAILGIIGSIAALWTLAAFMLTRVFTRSPMKRRLLGHSAFWMATSGIINFICARNDSVSNGTTMKMTQISIMLDLLLYASYITSRMLVAASVFSVALSYTSFLNYLSRFGDRIMNAISSKAGYRQMNGSDMRARSLMGSDSHGNLLQLALLNQENNDAYDSTNFMCIAFEITMHIVCVGTGTLAAIITLMLKTSTNKDSNLSVESMSANGNDTFEIRGNDFNYGSCWPWLVLNPVQMILAIIFVSISAITNICSMRFVNRKEAPISRLTMDRNYRASDVSPNEYNTSDDYDQIAEASSLSEEQETLSGDDNNLQNEYYYEYQWEAELDFLPTLTRTERLFAYVNFEVFCCLVNLISCISTTIIIYSNLRDIKENKYSRLESALLYFDGIVSSLRGCWLFALYGYRPGVLYLAAQIRKYVLRYFGVIISEEKKAETPLSNSAGINKGRKSLRRFTSIVDGITTWERTSVEY